MKIFRFVSWCGLVARVAAMSRQRTMRLLERETTGRPTHRRLRAGSLRLVMRALGNKEAFARASARSIDTRGKSAIGFGVNPAPPMIYAWTGDGMRN
jgi:hypothetical protein